MRLAPTWWHGGIALLVLLAARSVAAQDNRLELAVKATYLAKLPPFVVWPSEAAEFPGGVFDICILGPDPLGSLLVRAIEGQTVTSHWIVIHHLDAVPNNPSCSLVYISNSNPAAVAALNGRPVLTVTEAAADATAKGIINFIMIDNRVRFQIDVAAAARNGLGISSKLLSLAAPSDVVAK